MNAGKGLTVRAGRVQQLCATLGRMSGNLKKWNVMVHLCPGGHPCADLQGSLVNFPGQSFKQHLISSKSSKHLGSLEGGKRDFGTCRDNFTH